MDARFDAPNGAPDRRAPARRGAVSSLVFASLFAALIAAGGFVRIPVGPVPVVLQNLFSLLAGLVLGPFLGAGAVALFLAAGIAGAPIFAGGNAGLAFALGPTGGYYLGFLLGAFLAGLVVGAPSPGRVVSARRIALAAFLGMAVVYVPGLLWLRFHLDDWRTALVAGLNPVFLAGDAVKGAAAGSIAPRLRGAAAQLLFR